MPVDLGVKANPFTICFPGRQEKVIKIPQNKQVGAEHERQL
jgi:hypothetical protein